MPPSVAAAERPPAHPDLSVIVPARDAGATLRRSLTALRASTLPRERWELIVVDDASDDATARIAGRLADVVIRINGSARGPAHARNHGAWAARADVLVFVDADVCVHPDALARFARVLGERPDVAAVFGAYDTRPPGGFVSQYRNLAHHWVHARAAGEAETFWAGCGAVRRAAFTAVGGFDERRYPTPQIEDIELGYRLRALGHRILLRPEIRAKHLKEWTLADMVRTDLLCRGIPWVRTLLRRRARVKRGRAADRRRSATLNIRPAERFYTALTGLAFAGPAAGAALGDARWLLATALCLAAVVVGNLPLLRWFRLRRGTAFALRVMPLRVLYYALNVVAVAAGVCLHLRDRARSGGPTNAPDAGRGRTAPSPDTPDAAREPPPDARPREPSRKTAMPCNGPRPPRRTTRAAS